MLLTILTLLAGFVLLIKGGDWLVTGASSLARALGLSDLVIGLTVVSFGTSAPELFVGVLASLRGTSDITMGNVLGSNIVNILLIVGTAAMIYPLWATRGTVWKEIPFMLLASCVLAIAANDALFTPGGESVLSRGDALILLAFFAIFIYYIGQVIGQLRRNGTETNPPEGGTGRALGLLGLGLGLLLLGAHWVVESAVAIAHALDVSENLIGLSVVALGTSLPELVTSGVAAYKRNCDLAVGNVVGSNIFNVLFILGICGVIAPIPLPQGGGADTLFMLFATVLLFLAMLVGRPRNQIQRIEGAVFVVLYAAYIGFVVWRG